MSQTTIKYKEPLAPTVSWQLAIDSTIGGDFTWVQAVYDESTITNGVKVCVVGISNPENTISPIYFSHSGQWRPIIGVKILTSGKDIGGSSHTTTAGATLYAYRGL